MMDFLISFNHYGRKIRWWQNFTAKVYFNSLMACNNTGGKTLEMKEIFFRFILHSMQINWWRNCIDKIRIFYIHSIQISRSLKYTDARHFLYVQPPWHGNKLVGKFYS